MPRRDRLGALVALLLVASAFLSAAACGDGGDFLLDEGTPGATGTPSFLQRTPEPTPTPSPAGSPLAVGATPVTPFEITADAATNLRAEPSTDADVADTLQAGDTATVVATIAGEAVSADNDVWYELEDGSFVYSGVVQKVVEE